MQLAVAERYVTNLPASERGSFLLIDDKQAFPARRPCHFPYRLFSKGEGLNLFGVIVENVNSTESIARLSFRICDLFTVVGPGQPARQGSHGRDVQHLLVTAIEIRIKHPILPRF